MRQRAWYVTQVSERAEPFLWQGGRLDWIGDELGNLRVALQSVSTEPEAISVWPQKIRLKGRALLSRPMMKYARHGACHRNGTTSANASAASVRRANTTVNGSSSPQRHLGEEERAAPQDGE